MDFILLFVIFLVIILWIILMIIISEKAMENMERMWRIVKVETIVCIFINLFIWGIKSIKVDTLKNPSGWVVIGAILLFIHVGLRWNRYKKTTLLFEKSLLFSGHAYADGQYKSSLKASLSRIFSLTLFQNIIVILLNICFLNLKP